MPRADASAPPPPRALEAPDVNPERELCNVAVEPSRDERAERRAERAECRAERREV